MNLMEYKLHFLFSLTNNMKEIFFQREQILYLLEEEVIHIFLYILLLIYCLIFLRFFDFQIGSLAILRNMEIRGEIIKMQRLIFIPQFQQYRGKKNMINRTNYYTQQISRGQSVGSKCMVQNARSFEPKFITNIKNYGGEKDKIKIEKPVITLKKQNIPPAHFATHESKTKIGFGISEEIKKTEVQKKQTQVEQQYQIRRIQNQRERSKTKKKNRFSCNLRGFYNIGNTCYMNSTLQCLLHQPLFNYALLAELKKKCGEASEELRLVIKQLSDDKNTTALNLRDFKKAIGLKKPIFLGHAQHDAQEFLTSILQIFNSQLSRVREKPEYKQLEGNPNKKPLKSLSEEWWQYYLARDNSIICDYLQGQMISTVTCFKCKSKSVSFDNFWGLPVTLKKRASVQDMIKGSWGVDESVDEYYCSNCKKIRSCTKKIQLFKIPDILIIQLKRFDFSKGYRRKRNDEININHSLDISSVMNSQSSEKKQSKYLLKGVVHHYGEAQFGHYNAQIFCEKDAKWYCMDDSSVSSCSEPSSSKSAYLFFYQKNL